MQAVPHDIQQVTLYALADIVITAHAGSMTNSQFMKPRSVLIEIGGYHYKVGRGCMCKRGEGRRLLFGSARSTI